MSFLLLSQTVEDYLTARQARYSTTTVKNDHRASDVVP